MRINKPYGERVIESAWTDCLVEGDYIDVIKQVLLTHPNEDTKSTCRAFSRAKITKIEEKDETEEETLERFERGKPKPRTLTVCMLGELKEREHYFETQNIERIGPFKMYTSAWEWRMNLKIGDAIDCCDEYHNWFTALVLKIRDCTGQEKGEDIDGIPI